MGNEDVFETKGEGEELREIRVWDSQGDSRVRTGTFDHLRADGNTALPDGPFTVSGEKLMFPGDESLGASKGNVKNCRCSAYTEMVEVSKVRRGRVAKEDLSAIPSNPLTNCVDVKALVCDLEVGPKFSLLPKMGKGAKAKPGKGKLKVLSVSEMNASQQSQVLTNIISELRAKRIAYGKLPTKMKGANKAMVEGISHVRALKAKIGSGHLASVDEMRRGVREGMRIGNFKQTFKALGSETPLPRALIAKHSPGETAVEIMKVAKKRAAKTAINAQKQGLLRKAKKAQASVAKKGAAKAQKAVAVGKEAIGLQSQALKLEAWIAENQARLATATPGTKRWDRITQRITESRAKLKIVNKQVKAAGGVVKKQIAAVSKQTVKPVKLVKVKKPVSVKKVKKAKVSDGQSDIDISPTTAQLKDAMKLERERRAEALSNPWGNKLTADVLHDVKLIGNQNRIDQLKKKSRGTKARWNSAHKKDDTKLMRAILEEDRLIQIEIKRLDREVDALRYAKNWSKKSSTKTFRPAEAVFGKGEEELLHNMDRVVSSVSLGDERTQKITKKALSSYVNQGYRQINNAMRDGRRTGAAKKRIDAIKGAIGKSKTTKDIKVYKGVNSHAIARAAVHLEPGDVIKNNQFLSTSISERVSRDFTHTRWGNESGVIFEINVPKGTKALCPNCRGVYSREALDAFEGELILDDVDFIVRKVFDEDDDGIPLTRIVVDLKPGSESKGASFRGWEVKSDRFDEPKKIVEISAEFQERLSFSEQDLYLMFLESGLDEAALEIAEAAFNQQGGQAA